MRIAVSAETNAGLDAPVNGHFGHSPYFTLVEVVDGQIGATQASPTRVIHSMSRARSLPSFTARARTSCSPAEWEPGSQLLPAVRHPGCDRARPAPLTKPYRPLAGPNLRECALR